MAIIAGAHKLWVNSKAYILKDQPTYDVGGASREEIEILGGEGPYFSEKMINSSVEGTFAADPSLSMNDLRGIKDATIVLECPNKVQIVFKNASFVGDCKADGDGGISFKFVGKGAADELKP